MATTLRTELTNAGCNVATATIILQDGVGKGTKGVGVPDLSPSNHNSVTAASTNARLDARFVHGNGGGHTVPKCVAFSADGLSMFMWVTLSNGNGGFQKIPITAAQYTANTAIPNFALV